MDAIYVICIACHVSCKPSGTKSLEAFFILSATLALVGTRSLVGGIVDGEEAKPWMAVHCGKAADSDGHGGSDGRSDNDEHDDDDVLSKRMST